jgi:hypothetical protein
MKGWELTEFETLGMPQVTDDRSSLFSTIPAPRVLQNQLDQMLEQYVANLEVSCLKGLQKAMLRNNKKEQNWVVLFIVVLLMLHIRERIFGGCNTGYYIRTE